MGCRALISFGIRIKLKPSMLSVGSGTRVRCVKYLRQSRLQSSFGISISPILFVVHDRPETDFQHIIASVPEDGNLLAHVALAQPTSHPQRRVGTDGITESKLDTITSR